MSTRKTLSWLALPITIWYAIVVAIRNLLFELGVLHQTIPPVTTIGVGNIAVGGTGKTPLADYLLGLFSDSYSTAVVSRGYKRKSSGCIVLQPGSEEGGELLDTFGDEVSMLISKHPDVAAAVFKKRNEAISQLLSSDTPPQLIILDDVYQHRYVKPTINILLTEYNRLYSDDLILPYGNLRESRSASRRANVIIVTKTPKKLNSLERRIISERLKVKSYQKLFFSYIDYAVPVPLFDSLSDSVSIADVRHMLCVTGIANPDPLLAELRQRGIRVEHMPFSDHHDFTAKDIEDIKKRFDAINSQSKIIITTEKDALRLRKALNDDDCSLPIYYIPISIGFHDENGVGFTDYITSIVHENISFLSRLSTVERNGLGSEQELGLN
ncbi:MAG: tetraacyldisaccharide 4'-kinase [Bacteroidales bacterium]|nr:tetraacyldisaccharide 4'-kinase [Bacteroidales bacterium]